MSTHVSLVVDGPVAEVHVDRAERHNSLVPALLAELDDCLRAADEAEGVGAIVVTTAGESFSTGGDVAAFYQHHPDLAAYADEVVGGLHAVMLRMLSSPRPVLVAVDGQVTGGSVGLLLAADLVYLDETATITPYYASVGFSPDGGWTTLMPAAIGRARTAEILTLDRSIAPTQAVDWGLANDLVEGDVVERTRSIARSIADGPADTRAATMRLLRPDLDAVERGLDRERRAFVRQIQTEEALEGMRTFLGRTT